MKKQFGEKLIRYSINKLKIGVSLTLVGTFFIFGSNLVEANNLEVNGKADNVKNTNEKNTTTPFKKIELDSNYAEKISKGLIGLENGKYDSLLFNKGTKVLDPNADDDNDGILNKDEIYIYEKNGKKYLGYNSHPLLKDSDGDGLIDTKVSEYNNNSTDKDNDNLQWHVTDRDMALLMELCYRDDEYINKVLNNNRTWSKEDNYRKNGEKEGRKEYELMHNELAPYWKVKEFYHKDSGFDAVLFETRSELPFLKNGTVQVLAIRGTQAESLKDLTNDFVIAWGQNPTQAEDAKSLIRSYINRDDITNLYITGHSLGGYLAQRAVVDAYELSINPYYIESAQKKNQNFYNNILKKATTFNAPKVNAARTIWSKDLFNSSLYSKKLAQSGEIKHYGVENDALVGKIYNDKDVMTIIGKTERGHSSRSYFESIANNIKNFKIGSRNKLDGVGAQEKPLKTLKQVSLTDEEYKNLFKPRLVENSIEITKNAKLTKEDILSKIDKTNLPENIKISFSIPKTDKEGEFNVPITITYLDRNLTDTLLNISVKIKDLDLTELKNKKMEMENLLKEFSRSKVNDEVIENLKDLIKKTDDIINDTTKTQEEIYSEVEKLEKILNDYRVKKFQKEDEQ
ncbi:MULTISPECIES: YSIRK-type signal peptide-containing protein [Gemella]|uniref:YSIRK-type signal peptide-containing protein n=1 Tax=Gemella TaxID=1378 RepID=UPI000768405E|nr:MULTISPECIES: YSIRK-type signal peptide-containing protein [Gemella]AME08717.1 hypothetical protein AXE85_00175 [Gemella sp. oral taxon 928]AXI26292.1 hypothetical protein CG018_01940 [Gemella sp. ND 6198]